MNEELLVKALLKSPVLNRVFEVVEEINIPFEYYIGAGCVTNTVWNEISGYPLDYGISDIDLVYFNSTDMNRQSEEKLQYALENKLKDFPLKLDVKNQARVHLWYEKKFGFPIEPYPSLDAAIDSWPSTATAIGVRKEHIESFKIYAPYGLDDLFSMVVRANKLLVTQEIFERKAKKWKEKWPKLEIVPW